MSASVITGTQFVDLQQPSAKIVFDVVKSASQCGQFEMRMAIDETGQDRGLSEILGLGRRIFRQNFSGLSDV
jgi:hypothetical protein